jgi:CheY-like chemotaxis protein
LGVLVRGVQDLVASAVGPAVSVAVEISDPLPLGKADRHQLEMAILNLGVNARDAMDGSGRLTISVAAASVGPDDQPGLKPGDYLRLCVSDTGKGMDEETRAKAIEPFFSTKGVGQGTGLGLSMAHGLAAQLGGALTIESWPGAGTEVAIWLPQCLEPLAANAPKETTSLPSNEAALVLLVDDEAHIRAIISEMLTELGYRVYEALSPESALAAVDSGLRPDILVTDHLMPGMTGVELAHALLERRPDARALIISGFAEVESLDTTFPRLTKPFVHGDLAAALASIQCEPLRGGSAVAAAS